MSSTTALEIYVISDLPTDHTQATQEPIHRVVCDYISHKSQEHIIKYDTLQKKKKPPGTTINGMSTGSLHAEIFKAIDSFRVSGPGAFCNCIEGHGVLGTGFS
jgi:hypothetical protein